MSKRTELKKEYYKEFGNYKGEGRYSDHYVEWLENKILDVVLDDVIKCEHINRMYNEGTGYYICSDCGIRIKD
tara:strand:- start:7 stop:225 length:219 start_codon:yes stop_codon:yes gene_type:complete